MRIGVVGAGYVGLATAVGLAKKSHTITCVERDLEKLKALRDRESPVGEPGYPHEAAEALDEGRLVFTDNYRELADCMAIFLTVGTPVSETGAPDLSALWAAGQNAASVEPKALLVVKSTAPPGTARRLSEMTGSRVASNPEFLREGYAIYDFLNPSRIVMGADSPQDADLLLEIYRGFDAPKVVTDTPTAELSKYASNLFLAVKVSFANLIADMARATGASGADALRIAGMDPRIGEKYLSPGLGWGGSCIPKDLSAMIWLANEKGIDPALLLASENINRARITLVVDTLKARLGSLSGKEIALLGLSFKGGTPDTNQSQALKLAAALCGEGVSIRAYDPKAIVPGVRQFSEAMTALSGAHAAVVATDWEEFALLDPEGVRCAMRFPVIVDARGILSAEKFRAAGIDIIRLDEPANPVRG
ncbi:MAG: UDP-glucose dehydrogenase family protein [candidate division WOR-3 bacterium]